jgi:hypothetical protein
MDEMFPRGALPDDQTRLARWHHLTPDEQEKAGIGPKAHDARIRALKDTPGAGMSDHLVEFLEKIGVHNLYPSMRARNTYPATTKSGAQRGAIEEAMRMEKEGYRPPPLDVGKGMGNLHATDSPRSISEMEKIDAYLRQVLGKK